MKRFLLSSRVAAVAAALLVPCLRAAEPAPAPAPVKPAAQERKVLLIGIDGCRVDCLTKKYTPVLRELADKGVFASKAFTGGITGTKSLQPTMSGPGWSTILTGVWTDKHGVTGNGFENHRMKPDAYPHFIYRLKSVRPALLATSAAGWGPIDSVIVAPVKDSFEFRFKGDGSGDHHEAGDVQVQKKITARLAAEKDDFYFVHYDQVDGAGHKYGFGPKTPEYLAALDSVDKLVAEDLAAIRSRKTYANEEWLVLVTTDHGGEGTSHGSQSAVCRNIFVIANGPGVEPRKTSAAVPQTAIAPTVADWFGIPVAPAWGWEAKSVLK